MRTNKKPWLVAFVASSFSFFCNILSLMLVVLHKNPQIKTLQNGILAFCKQYEILNTLHEATTKLLGLTNNLSWLFALFGVLVFTASEKGFINKINIKGVEFNFTISKLYTGLLTDFYTNTLYKLLYNFLCKTTYVNGLVLCITLGFSNNEAFLISSLSMVFLVLGGFLYSSQTKKWEKKMCEGK